MADTPPPQRDPAGSFAWRDDFLLGFAPMDDVHREFVAVVAAMIDAPDAALADRLEEFLRHAESHFAQELAWMHDTEFPPTQCHADEHEAVLKSVREVLPMVRGGNFEVGRRLAAELVRWFPGHADYLDSALAQWLVKRIHGGAPVVLRRRPVAAP